MRSSSFGQKADWLFTWNLLREDFERLADQLSIDTNRDLLRGFAGRNPRALGIIAGKVSRHGSKKRLWDIIGRANTYQIPSVLLCVKSNSKERHQHCQK